MQYSDGTPSVSYVYNTAGQTSMRTDASGATTLTYDPLGRLASRSHTAGGGVLSYTYDRAGNLLTEADANGTTLHSYDTRNVLTSTQTPDGLVIAYGYDTDGRRTDTWFATNAAKTAWAAHTHTDYDTSGRTARVWTARASDNTLRVSDLSYSYASPGTASCPTAPAAGIDTQLVWSQTDHLAARTTSYCYDDANRLTAATTPGGDTWTYAYDINGNRTQTVKNGAVVQTQTVNNADQLTDTGYAHDGSGNLTGTPSGATMTYNGSEQLVARSGTSKGSYTYAGTTQDELITQVGPGGATYTHAWGRTDHNGLPILGSLATADGTAYFFHDDAGTPLAIKSRTGTTGYYALDGLGSPVALIKTNGLHQTSYSYDPHGAVTETNNLTDNTVTTSTRTVSPAVSGTAPPEK